MLDSFLTWAQAFMLQVALAARSGYSLTVPAVSAIFFFFVLFRGIRPLPIPRFCKVLCAIPAFLGAFYILIYISLSRGSAFSDELQTPLTLLSFISAVVIIWALILIGRDICLAARALFRFARKFTARRSTSSTEKMAAPHPETERLPDPSRRRFLRNGSLLLAAGVTGSLGAHNALGAPQVIPVDLKLPRLPLALDGLRIVQLSDLHVSPVLSREWVQTVVEKANALHPDLVLLTGDFVDGHPEELMRGMEPLMGLNARYGVHSCTGNHDFYSGLTAWLPHFRELGLNVLRNEHTVLNINGTPLTLIGLHDLNERIAGQGPDIQRALAGAPQDAFRILLEHHPQEAPHRGGLVDLMLSGHTHGGQIPLLAPLVRRANNGFIAGSYHVGDMLLYVNRGTGIWGGLPLRLGVPAEISLLTLRRPK